MCNLNLQKDIRVAVLACSIGQDKVTVGTDIKKAMEIYCSFHLLHSAPT
jgi:hypothetical protein